MVEIFYSHVVFPLIVGVCWNINSIQISRRKMNAREMAKNPTMSVGVEGAVVRLFHSGGPGTPW